MTNHSISNKHSINKLDELLENADRTVLIQLVKTLLDTQPKLYQHALNTITTLVAEHQLISEQKPKWDPTDDWMEIEEQIEALDRRYEDCAVETLDEAFIDFSEKLNQSDVTKANRQFINSRAIELLSTIELGIYDQLAEIAIACCHSNDELTQLGQQFEALGSYLKDPAIAAYKAANDEYNYLRLRLPNLNNDSDFHDLATYYWQNGEHQQGIKWAKKGLTEKNQYSAYLFTFLADAALYQGDRATYLKHHFTVCCHHITLERYKAFEARCTPDEWPHYDEAFRSHLQDDDSLDIAKIHHYRNDHDMAMRYFTASDITQRYFSRYDDYSLAQQYEEHYPEQILNYYRAVLGPLDESHSRDTYAFQATIMARVRVVLVNILNSTEDWRYYAREVRYRNARRPAFQHEFSKAIEDWRDL